MILVRAGEIMDDEIGDTRVNAETMNVAAHLRFMLQFLGLDGSKDRGTKSAGILNIEFVPRVYAPSGPSQST
jgi:hypothetical protein